MKFSAIQLKNKMPLLAFFLKLSLLFFCWFFLYVLVLREPRFIDRPLTNLISSIVSTTLNSILPSTDYITVTANPHEKAEVFLNKNGSRVLRISDGCNGLDLIFIFCSVIFLLPGSTKKKLLYSSTGIASIIIADVLRIISLYFIYVYYQSQFEFSHHYVFTILMYILIFMGWFSFINCSPKNEKGV